MQRMRMLVLSTIVLTFGLVLAASQSTAQEAKLPRVGVILLGGPGPRYDALRQDFAQLGYAEGRNIIFEPRFVRGQLEQAPALAAELVALNVDVIVAMGAVGVGAAQKVTTKIPIVFAVVLDPVALGYAATLGRPGGNITGITSFDPQQATKQFEMLKEVIPNLARVAILSDQNIPRTDGWNPLERANDAAARALGLRPQWLRVKGPAPDLDGAFAAMLNENAQALLVLEVPVTTQHLKPIAELAAKRRVPTMFPGGWENEGLITYGTSFNNAVPRIAGYVAKILKGAKPGDLPIEVVTRRELIFNLKTAREIGVTISPELLKRADRVLQ
jgi:putative tryptophan/tyrosine transport system substrate-binding protein